MGELFKLAQHLKNILTVKSADGIVLDKEDPRNLALALMYAGHRRCSAVSRSPHLSQFGLTMTSEYVS